MRQNLVAEVCADQADRKLHIAVHGHPNAVWPYIAPLSNPIETSDGLTMPFLIGCWHVAGEGGLPTIHCIETNSCKTFDSINHGLTAYGRELGSLTCADVIQTPHTWSSTSQCAKQKHPL